MSRVAWFVFHQAAVKKSVLDAIRNLEHARVHLTFCAGCYLALINTLL